jgi:1,4-dihydroxy-2-naphthoate octaprenyltransferase
LSFLPARARFRRVLATLLHLRFPFVYILSPIFVWGAAWGPAAWTARTTMGFVLVHLALYPGANAFNSAYDRDTGPIGGLARPPAVPSGLARWSTWLQAAGAALAPIVGFGFAGGYLMIWVMSVAYSHPRTRWKRSPLASTATVVVGQGGIGFWLGWCASGTGSTWADWGARDARALMATCAIVAALWPLTQVYQVDADRARLDRTLASVLGTRGTLAWSSGGFAAGAAALFAAGSTELAAYAAASAVAAAVAAVAWPAGRVPSHRAVMWAAYVTSTVFLAAIVWRAALGTLA